MSKLRSINTSIWSDPWIEELQPIEKLLFIYLITNEKTNMLGIYESSIKKISFETGIEKSKVDKALKGFESVGKVKYANNYVILVNFLKHQNYNPNMMKSAIDIYNNLPKELNIKTETISKLNPSEGFETLSKRLGMVRKIEVEYEDEFKEEKEDEEKKEELVFPFDSDQFMEAWNIWKKFKKQEFKFAYKSIISEQAALQDLSKKSNGMEHVAIAIIHQSIANGWKGFFDLKHNNNGNNKKQSVADLVSYFAANDPDFKNK